MAGLVRGIGPVPVAHAATFTVTSTADDVDRSPTDGRCLTAAGECTLRAAIQEANRRAGADTIVLQNGLAYTLTRTGAGEDISGTGDLDIRSNLTITVSNGGRAVVQGASGWDDRIFHVSNSATVQMSGVDILNGRAVRGGGILIDNGTVTLSDSTIRSNSAIDDGGGIYNGAGTVLLAGCIVSGNAAGGRGGGLANARHLTLTNTAVNGNVAVLDGGGLFNSGSGGRLFDSTVSGNTAVQRGGGIFDGGGGLILTRTIVNSNSAASHGGGIYLAAFAVVELTSSAVSGNAAGDEGGGIFHEDGTLRLTHSTISINNAQVDGGGISSHFGFLTLTNSSVSGNAAFSDGGGIKNLGRLTLINSTVSGNTATVDGGGILNVATALLTNSTLSGNRAGRHGGGIWNQGGVTADNVTLAENIADNNGDETGHGGGVYNPFGGSLIIANTIIGRNLDHSPTTRFPDCFGTLTSEGYNLVQNTIGCTIDGDTTGNITGMDPRLGALANNGGPTLTHALLHRGVGVPVDSPAMDAGNPATPGSGETACVTTDQRGTTRPRDGTGDGISRCDIGAYEALPLVFVSLGTFALAPAEASVEVGEHLHYHFTWTVPGPGWRVLDTLHLRILDDEDVILWVHFQEVAGGPGIFGLVNSKNGNVGPGFAPGSPHRLESEWATLHLAGSAVAGPPGPEVALTMEVSFKPRAASRVGRGYTVEVLAIDDTGEQQGFAAAGTLTVLPARR